MPLRFKKPRVFYGWWSVVACFVNNALLAGFADYYIPQDRWRELTENLIETGDWSVIDQMAEAGIVGEYKGSQAREVVMTLAEWDALKAQVAADQAAGYEADQDEEDLDEDEEYDSTDADEEFEYSDTTEE